MNGQPMGFSLREQDEILDMPSLDQRIAEVLQREAAEFRSSWSQLSPYQQKLAKGKAHKAGASVSRCTFNPCLN